MIFGLKIKQLRQAKGLSFSDLSEATGVSISYLNEIEKGKKYPKEDKIRALAKALGQRFEELVSTKLPTRLHPVSELLESNFLNDLPLDLFGIDAGKIVEIIADSPAQVGAFISTILEMVRHFALQQESFYFASLRSYQELHHNYFEDLEQKADKFAEQFLLSGAVVEGEQLSNILTQAFGYKIDRNLLDKYPSLQSLQSVFVDTSKTLLLNAELTPVQETNLLGREVGFNALKIQERASTSSLLAVSSFQQVLNHFRASYFAGALMVNRNDLVEDLQVMFAKEQWDDQALDNLMEKYQVAPETLMQRLTNLLPEYFDVRQLFYLKFQNEPGTDDFELTEELHLSNRHQPHANALKEHYCRRWITLRVLRDLSNRQEEGEHGMPLNGVQRSRFIGSDDEYLCFTIAHPGAPTSKLNFSVTVGLAITDQLKERIKFWNDPTIPLRFVNNTCQRCAIPDCKERVAPPEVVDQKTRKKQMLSDLEKLLENHQ